MLFKIIVPAIVPDLVTALRLTVSIAWLVVVAAEMIRSSEGVGWIIITSGETNNTVQTLVGIVAIGIIGFTLAIFMRGVEEKLCRWNKRGI